MADEPLGEQEMIEILEAIARGSANDAARIAAIRALPELRRAAALPAGAAFGALYEIDARRISGPAPRTWR
jgi:hypothetical protein